MSGVMATNSSFYFSPSVFTTSTTPTPSWSTTESSSSIPPATDRPRRRSSTYKQEETVDMKGITSEEFEVLPPVVRRKYFSSLERLRLANDPSTHTHRDSLPRNQNVKSQFGRSRVQPAVGKNGSRRLSKTSPFRQNSISQADAQWFMGLPEKLKRTQFTEEERSYLMGKCASLVGDAADDAFRKRRQQSITESSISPSVRSSLDGVEEKEMLSEVDLGADLDDPLQWLDDGNELDLQFRLDNYRARIAAHDKLLNSPVQRRVKRSSLRQVRFSPSRPSERNWTLLHQNPLGMNPQSRQGSVSSSIEHPTKKLLPGETPSGESNTSATYYRDPEARLKLRVYLASPQKFDEAIEFGFPSTDTTNDLNIAKKETTKERQPSRLNTAVSQSDIQTFLNEDDGASSLFFDDEESDDEEASSPSDTDAPLTPSEVIDNLPFRSPHRLPYAAKLHAKDSTAPTVAGTRPRMFDSYAYAPPATTGREMTLRITLTRPDLDVRPNTSYTESKQHCPDPLTLEELTTAPKRKDGSRLRPDSILLTGSDGSSSRVDDGVTGGGIGVGLVKKFLKKLPFKR